MVFEVTPTGCFILTPMAPKLDHRRKGKAHGRPMSGLSIPADYYLGRAGRTIAPVGRGKKPAKTNAGK